MKSYYVFLIFILYSILRRAFKGQRRSTEMRNAPRSNPANRQMPTARPPVNPDRISQAFDSSEANVQADVEAAVLKLRQRAGAKPFEQQAVYKEYDNAEAGVSNFQLNQGFSKKERLALDRSFDLVTESAKPRAYKFAYTADTIRNYFIMKEVLDAPRAMKPFVARRSYYDPRDSSRE